MSIVSTVLRYSVYCDHNFHTAPCFHRSCSKIVADLPNRAIRSAS